MLDPLPNWIQFTMGLEVAKKKQGEQQNESDRSQ
jgi:hypothetical protein